MLTFLLATSLLALSIVLVAANRGFKQGQFVAVIRDEHGISAAGEEVDHPPLGTVFEVRSVIGDTLEVSRGIPGTISADSVILVEEAIKYFTLEIGKEETNAAMYAARAATHAFQKDHQAALDDIRLAISLDPQAQWFNLRGELYDSMNEFDRAKNDFDRALTLASDNDSALKARVLCNLGGYYFVRGEEESSLTAHENSVTIEPANAESWGYYGRACGHFGRKEKALQCFSRAIEIDPRNINYYYDRSHDLERMRQYERAIADLESIIALDATEHRAHNSLAWLLATCSEDELRDGERAVRLATTACELTEWQDMQLIQTLAAAHAETGNFKKAIETIEIAIQAEDGLYAGDYEEDLRLYRKRKPFR